LVNPLDTKKKANLFIVLMILVIVLAYIIFSPSGLINRIILTQRRNELQKKIEFEKRVEDSLSRSIIQIQNDTTEIERIAREKFGMKRPNEKIYIVPLDKSVKKK